MKKTSERELDIANDTVCLQLRAQDGKNRFGNDYWPLATLAGGIEEMTFSREGDTTVIRIRSPEATIWCDDVRRPPTMASVHPLPTAIKLG